SACTSARVGEDENNRAHQCIPVFASAGWRYHCPSLSWTAWYRPSVNSTYQAATSLLIGPLAGCGMPSWSSDATGGLPSERPLLVAIDVFGTGVACRLP